MSCDKSLDVCDDTVDPRVQVELERLNTATDEINKLEVDLDDSKNQFRLLLAESTVRLESCAKKLGACIERAKPYYDARLKAKEALQETQKAAAQFEKANSAHSAAKEMVYLAEEGLKAEGRTFDHAWQEMLNHATMRVNESEAERTVCEIEHKRTSHSYHLAEMKVQTLQRELKRAITKSSLRIRRQLMFLSIIANQHNLLFLPYFELKIQYNQVLEQQRKKVKDLERQVSEVKTCYADTLRNLEHISDEIHKTRQSSKQFNSGFKSLSENLPNNLEICAKSSKNLVNSVCEEKDKNILANLEDDRRELAELQTNRDECKLLTPISEISCPTKLTPNTPASSQPDTDFWSESSETGHINVNGSESIVSDNDSSVTGPPDSESDDEFFELPSKLNCFVSQEISHEVDLSPRSTISSNQFENSNRFKDISETDENLTGTVGEIIKTDICSLPGDSESSNYNLNKYQDIDNICNDSNNDLYWTEINLNSPDEIRDTFTKLKKNIGIKSKSVNEEDFDIPYTPLPETEHDFNISVNSTTWDKKKNKSQECSDELNVNKEEDMIVSSELNNVGLIETPRKLLNKPTRRQSLDVLWNNATGEKVKEMLSHGMLKLNIGSIGDRRSSDSRNDHDLECETDVIMAKCGEGTSSSNYESNLYSQFGLQFFSRKMKGGTVNDETATTQTNEVVKLNGHSNESLTNQIGGFISRKERFFSKKVPSPLEKSKTYLNTDDESNSDCESLPSMDMISDDQLTSLILDRDLNDIYQDLL